MSFSCEGWREKTWSRGSVALLVRCVHPSMDNPFDCLGLEGAGVEKMNESAQDSFPATLSLRETLSSSLRQTLTLKPSNSSNLFVAGEF
jgi:hypothetical protein